MIVVNFIRQHRHTQIKINKILHKSYIKNSKEDETQHICIEDIFFWCETNSKSVFEPMGLERKDFIFLYHEYYTIFKKIELTTRKNDHIILQLGSNSG